MRSGSNLPRKALAMLVTVGIGVTSISVPATAQDNDARLRRMESELRALQRAVFPNSDGRFFTPEVSTSDSGQPQQQIGIPSSTALSDMLIRLDTLESQIARLTAASEENAAQMREIETRLAALEQGGAAPASTAADTVTRVAPATGVIQPPGESRPQGQRELAPAQSSAAQNEAPSAERLAAVQAIAKPATEDPGDDEYVYGFRLWEAELYPEARQQLAKFVEEYPSHWRTTYGRNLLGRAFLDDGDPRGAATHFLANYQADKQAARAGDSLLYLAESMIAMDDTNRACIALATFGDEYPALAAGRLKDQYDRNRDNVTCN